MNPVTHILLGWTVADQVADDSPRDLALVAWAGVMPDLDGLGAIADTLGPRLGFAATSWYEDYHHILLHGIFGAVVISALVTVFARRRMRVALFAFLMVHLHLVCDLVGSRGPTPADIWAVHYLEPFSSAWTIAWDGQWALDAWPNILFTVMLMLWCFRTAVVRGRSPVALFSTRADAAVVATLRMRWQRLTGKSVASPETD